MSLDKTTKNINTINQTWPTRCTGGQCCNKKKNIRKVCTVNKQVIFEIGKYRDLLRLI